MRIGKKLRALFQKKESVFKFLPSNPKSVILPVKTSPGKYAFFCPGCESSHVINTTKGIGLPVHTLTGTSIKPTIRASVLSKGDNKVSKPHCHSFVTKGSIQFFNDCSHPLAGKTVRLNPY